MTSGVAAQSAPDPRDARIDALEAQVRALTRTVEALSRAAQPGAAAASPQTRGTEVATAAVPTSAPAASRASGDRPARITPSRSPDQPRPVVSSEPGPNQGFATFEGAHPSIHSMDGRFAAILHGVLHFDGGGYFQKRAGPLTTDLRRGGGANDAGHARDLSNGTVLRRARIGIDGHLFDDFEYNVLLDFGGSGVEDAGHVFELWAQYSGIEPFHLRVGAFAPSIGLEDQNSVQGMPLMERPAISDISRGIAGGDFREAIQLTAARRRWFAALALTTRTVGTINTGGSGTAQSFDQNFGGVARLAAIPFQGKDWLVHVGAHGSRVFSVSDAGGPDGADGDLRHPVELRERPELRTDGTRLIDTGTIDARHVNEVGLELAVQSRNVYVQGEYEFIGIERRDRSLENPHFGGWYVEGGWVLTGERRKYNTGTFAFDAPPVSRVLDPAKGGFGAVELVGRYSYVDLNYKAGARGTAISLDGVRGGEQRIVAAGINWYLNPVLRLMLDYQHVRVRRLSPDPTAYATPLGAEIGQSYDTVAVRSQLAF
ncbi:porin [uncultured Sphingomonas sp.]|uniref:porin n=1 Tax=uncultured Sphingomonas sp. TaxID=158754 RepID=UPI0025D50CC7|nr:porin [uncultured Sphingomonas sp.]